MTALSWRLWRLPLLLIVLWCSLLFFLYRWTVQREDEYATELARIQTETFFSSIVHTRDWNADNGGVWVRETPVCPANPWLPEEERTLRGAGGETLVKVNPAYMTRQIAESFTSTLAGFRISSLSPKRPGNRADPWETGALLSFEEGRPEVFELVDQPGASTQYRYMAPLKAKENCLQCHQDKKRGDVLGGISVTLSAEPILAAASERKRTTAQAFWLIGVVGTIGIGGATFQINRKKELAEAANRMKSAFLANMTHDMRTPLTGILGMSELLERETRDSRHRYLLANLREATDSLLRVVDGIMRYSLLEAEGQPPRSEPFSLRAEVEACLAPLRPACESKGIQLTLALDPATPDRLIGDAFRLRQALGNLLGNAVKFTEKGSVVLRVAASEPARNGKDGLFLSFQVIDTGVGIPQEEQERIFERFEQGKTARQTEEGLPGVGLGLAIARGIARRFGGDLTLSSTPGMGSVFTLTAVFRLAPEGAGQGEARPAVSSSRGAPEEAASPGSCGSSEEDAAGPVISPSPPTSPLSAADAHARSLRLVVAEDTSVTALFLHETLTRAGYTVHTANCGEDALFLIRKVRPEAVLLDMRLPDMSGLDIARNIRSGTLGVLSGTPILVLTATLDPGDVEAFRRLGINGWLLKPVQTDRLTRAVADLLQTPEHASGTASPASTADAPRSAPPAPSMPPAASAPAARPASETAGFHGDGGKTPGTNATPCAAPPSAGADPAPTAVSPANASPVFDADAALRDLGTPSLLARLVDIFLSETPNVRANLALFGEQPGPAARLSELRRHAHSLKNGAGMLHLEHLRLLCTELERAAAEGDAARLPELTRAAMDALDQAADALRRHGGA